MTRPDFPYRKLPGVRHGIVSSASLWLGADHILHVKNTRLAEDYRRYYFTDIQAIYLQKTPRFLPPPVIVIAVVSGLFAILVLAILKRTTAVEIGWILLLAAGAYAAWICIFQSSICFIETALGTDRLSCLHRVAGARAAMDQISNHVLQVQGPAEEYTAQDVFEAVEPVNPARSRENLFGWLALPFVLIGSVLLMDLPMPIPDSAFQVALGALLATVILGVLALIAGTGRKRFRALPGAIVALILVCGLELYSLILVNIYSTPITSKEGHSSVPFIEFARAAHFAGIWLGGANIAVALVTAMLLFRNPSRSQA